MLCHAHMLCDFLSYYADSGIGTFAFKRKEIPSEYALDPCSTFTVLIACHNEEEVIVDNLYNPNCK